MKIWFDTEFIENGRTIDLISIGMVREDGATLYYENLDCCWHAASDWVRNNVFPYLDVQKHGATRRTMASIIRDFAGPSPEFIAYYADYDWVVLCQLYGTMMDLPDGWPKFCIDLQQERVMRGVTQLPEQTTTEHHALADALWTRQAWEHVMAQPRS